MARSTVPNFIRPPSEGWSDIHAETIGGSQMKPFFFEVVGAISQVLQLAEPPNWTEATRLEADLGMDSGLMLELIMQIEETIPGVVIDQATLSYDQFETIGSVCGFVCASQQQEAVV
ncbi:hypothetical protein FS764_25070 [Agrobacterium vitis]|nr:hypothetical protein [Agrobacterium vitis]